MQDGEEAFLNFRRVVESANVIMATYADEALGDTQVDFTSVRGFPPCRLVSAHAVTGVSLQALGSARCPRSHLLARQRSSPRPSHGSARPDSASTQLASTSLRHEMAI